MFRYLKAVQHMKKIIQDNKLEVMGTNSRYYGAYLYGDRLDWWDKSREYAGYLCLCRDSC